MGFSIGKQGDVVVVDVDGQLVVGNRDELKRAVFAEVDRGERRFLIHFGRAGFVDSSGLGVLVSLSKRIHARGGELRLAGLNPDLRKLFQLTRLDALFQIVESGDRAEADVRAPAQAAPRRAADEGALGA